MSPDFAFRYQKWGDVLEWYAEQTGLSLVADNAITGTFNCTDTKEFTVAESMDLLNSVLLPKGYALLRRDRMLLVVNIADGIPPDLVPRVTIDELSKRGKFELVNVIFPLGRRDAEEVCTAIVPLASPISKGGNFGNSEVAKTLPGRSVRPQHVQAILLGPSSGGIPVG